MPRPSFKRAIYAPIRGVKALTRMVFPRMGGALAQLISGARNDYTRMAGDPLKSSLIMAPLGWLMRNGQQAQLRVRIPAANDTLDVVKPTDLTPAARMLELLEYPNDHYDGATMQAAIFCSLALDDNAYILIVRNSHGAPVQLWWTPHTLIEPFRAEDSNQFIDCYHYMPTGIPIEIPVADVIHIRDGIDPNNPMKGLPKMRALLREVFTDNEAANYTATIMRNMGVPGLIISPEVVNGMAEPLAEDIDELKQHVKQATGGANRGDPLVLKRPTKIEVIGFDPSKMSAKDARRVPEERVSGVLGVPAIVCGLGAGLDRSTFANMSEAREMAAEEALIPKWNLIARTFKHQLLPQFEGDNARSMTVDFDTSTVRVLQEDEDKKVDRAARLVTAGVATVAEAREAAGLHVDEAHHIFLRTVNQIEVPEGETMATVLAAETPTAAPAKGTKSAITAAGQVRLGRALMRDWNTLSGKNARPLEALFGQLADHVLETYKAHAKANPTMHAKADGDLTVIAQRVVRAAKLDTWRSTHLGGELRKLWSQVGDQTAKTLAATIGMKIGNEDTYATHVLNTGGTRYTFVDIEAQTQKAILAALTEGRAAGDGVPELERRIRGYVEAGGKEASVSSRAMRIARTETKNAQRVSCINAYKQNNVTTLMALDDRLGHGDEDCADRNGKTFSMADAELEDDHPNGTLDWVPAIGDDSEA